MSFRDGRRAMLREHQQAWEEHKVNRDPVARMTRWLTAEQTAAEIRALVSGRARVTRLD